MNLIITFSIAFCALFTQSTSVTSKSAPLMWLQGLKHNYHSRLPQLRKKIFFKSDKEKRENPMDYLKNVVKTTIDILGTKRNCVSPSQDSTYFKIITYIQYKYNHVIRFLNNSKFISNRESKTRTKPGRKTKH